MKRTKIILALLLSVVMILSLLPSFAVAEIVVEGPTVEDPSHIGTVNLVFKKGQTIDITSIKYFSDLLGSGFFYTEDLVDTPDEDESPYIEYKSYGEVREDWDAGDVGVSNLKITAPNFASECEFSLQLCSDLDTPGARDYFAQFDEESAYSYWQPEWVYYIKINAYCEPAAKIVRDNAEDYFMSLSDAVEDADSGETIVLLADVSLTERLFVNAGATPELDSNNRFATTSENKSITLNLNGHNIASASNIALAGGSLNITGTGTISTSNAGLAPIEVRGTGDLTSKRTLTIGQNVVLQGVYGLNIFGSNDSLKNKIDVTVNGTVNGILFVLGNLKNTENEINIVVNGTVAAPAGPEDKPNVGIALNGYANVTVNNGAKISGDSGIEVRAGNLTVNGGTITAKAATYSFTANGSGTTSKGVGIAVAQHTTELPIDVKISGGDISGKVALALANPQMNKNGKLSVNVVGGTFTGTGEQTVAVILDVSETRVNGFISGGSFSSLVPDEYCATGYEPVTTAVNGLYTVAHIKVAQIGDTQYETLAAAVAAVPANGTPTTIKLIADETIVGNTGVTIPTNTNVVLDLNGHTLKNEVNEDKASQVIKNNGTLTIQDTSESQDGVIMNAIGDAQPGEWWSTPQYNYATNVITNCGTLNVVSGTIRQTAANSICYAIDNNNTSYDAIVNISGGTITDDHGTVIRMFCNSTTKKNEINISGGTVVTEKGYTALWTQLPGKDSTSMKQAKLNITGGTISGGEYAWYDYSYGDGWDNVEYSISDGRLNGYLYSYGKTGFITGGFYSTAPDAKYIAEGYEVVELSANEADPIDAAAYTAGYLYKVQPQSVTYVARIGDTQYETLAAAFAAVPANGGDTQTTITMLNNSLSEGTIAINGGKNVKLDLGGYAVTSSFMYVLNGKLEVANGTIVNRVDVYGATTHETAGYSTLKLGNDATVIGGVVLFNNGTSNPAYGAQIDIYGTVNTYVFVSGNIEEGDSVINVYNGATIAGEDIGIALNGMATVNVYGGTITGGSEDPAVAGTGIEVRSGNLNVTGGTITGKGAYAFNANGNGTTSTGCGIAVAQHTTEKDIQVNISGGDIRGTVALAIANPQRNDDGALSVNVVDGKFTSTAAQNAVAVILAEDETRVNGFITGGTFSSEPAAAYIATGYEAKAVDLPEGYYKIVKATGTAENTNDNKVQYDSVEEGISAVVTNGTVDSITTTAAATVGSVTIAEGGTVAVAANGDSGVTASGTTVVTATEVAITSGSETSAYAITKTVGNDVQGSTLATATLGNGMESNANPSVYVKDVADKLADAVLKSNETVSSNLEVNLALDVVTKNEAVSGNTIKLDVELQGVYTVNGTAGNPVEIPNSELATGASFTFRVAAPAGATKVNVVHSWENDPTYDTGSETFYDLPVVNGYVEVTLTHFSSLAISTSSTYVSTPFDGDNTKVDFVYNVYMNLQDGLYMTYIVYVSKQSQATTAVLTTNGTDKAILLSSVVERDESYNASMRSSVITNGYYCAKLTKTNGVFYYFVVSKYPNHMAKNVSIKLTDDESKTLTLYENTTMSSGKDVTECTLYTLENNVFTTTMVKFLTGFKNAQDSSSDKYKIAATLLDYYAYAKALYGEN